MVSIAVSKTVDMGSTPVAPARILTEHIYMLWQDSIFVMDRRRTPLGAILCFSLTILLENCKKYIKSIDFFRYVCYNI